MSAAAGVAASVKRNFKDEEGRYVTSARLEVLETPLLNKGTAFTRQERVALGLEGLLPAAFLSLEEQAERTYGQLHAQPSDLLKNVFLAAVHDATKCCTTASSLTTCASCCRSCTTRPWARRSSSTAMSTAARVGSTCRSTSRIGWRRRSATSGSAPTTWT